MEPPPTADLRPKIASCIGGGKLFVLRVDSATDSERGIASFCVLGNEGERFESVASVYTRPGCGGRGFATFIVAKATEYILKGGKTALLGIDNRNSHAYDLRRL